MAMNKGKFKDITGMWMRKKSVGNSTETSWYGQVRETITIPAGTQIHLYETRNKNRKSTDPQYHLKILEPTPKSEE